MYVCVCLAQIRNIWTPTDPRFWSSTLISTPLSCTLVQLQINTKHARTHPLTLTVQSCLITLCTVSTRLLRYVSACVPSSAWTL